MVDLTKVHIMPDRTRQANPLTSSPILLTDEQCAAVLGIGVRTFHSLRDEPWMPRPIVLGPRLLRWAGTELEAAVLNMPRQTERCEPAELRRSRIERLKRGAQ